MGLKVVELAPPPAVIPNEDAIEIVSQLLDRLITGEAIAVAFVEVLANRTIGHAWSDAPTGAFHLLNSGVSLLSHKFNAAAE